MHRIPSFDTKEGEWNYSITVFASVLRFEIVLLLTPDQLRGIVQSCVEVLNCCTWMTIGDPVQYLACNDRIVVPRHFNHLLSVKAYFTLITTNNVETRRAIDQISA